MKTKAPITWLPAARAKPPLLDDGHLGSKPSETKKATAVSRGGLWSDPSAIPLGYPVATPVFRLVHVRGQVACPCTTREPYEPATAFGASSIGILWTKVNMIEGLMKYPIAPRWSRQILLESLWVTN